MTDFTAEKYLVDTELKYKCDDGLFAGLQDYFSYSCVNVAGVKTWKSDNCYCLKYDGTPTNEEIRKSVECEVSTNDTIPKDGCASPPIVINAKLDLSESEFLVGQELHYSFLCEDQGQNRRHGVLKCEDSSAGIRWVKLSAGCANKTNRLHGKTNGSHQGNNCSHGESNASHQKAGVYAHYICVGVITAIMVIFAIFKIAQWRIKSTGNPMSAAKDEEMNAANVPLNEKQ
ncbi:uncharacterized protein LOC130366963 isoform X2 [Hyla sarda]|nr:uncharacterized protein LOC130366963 isoform X2 [Hyla sarda]